VRAAAFDFGSNTVGFLVGERAPDGALRVHDRQSRFVRLAEGMGRARRLTPAALERARAWAAEMGGLLAAQGITRRRAVATEAVRRAENAAELRALVEPLIGCPLETISGEEEARLTYRGVREGFPAGALAVLDIGGGSTELAVGAGGGGDPEVQSMPLGAVVLTEQHGEDWPALVGAVDAVLAVAPHPGARLVVLGGTAVNVALLDRGTTEFRDEYVEGRTVGVARLAELRERTRAATPEQRVTELGIPALRADVMVGALAILERTLRALGLDAVTCSRLSLRHGVLGGLLDGIR